MALREFDERGFDMKEVMKTTETPWAKRTIGALTVSEIIVFGLTFSVGDGGRDFLVLQK